MSWRLSLYRALIFNPLGTQCWFLFLWIGINFCHFPVKLAQHHEPNLHWTTTVHSSWHVQKKLKVRGNDPRMPCPYSKETYARLEPELPPRLLGSMMNAVILTMTLRPVQCGGCFCDPFINSCWLLNRAVITTHGIREVNTLITSTHSPWFVHYYASKRHFYYASKRYLHEIHAKKGLLELTLTPRSSQTLRKKFQRRHNFCLVALVDIHLTKE